MSNVAFVMPDAAPAETRCTQAAPCLLDTAIQREWPTAWLLPRPGTSRGEFAGPFVLEGRAMRLFAEPGTATLTRPTSGVVLTVKSAAALTMYGIGIDGGSQAGTDGISGSMSAVDLRHVTISNLVGIAISISGGSLALFQSTIADNHGGGVQVTLNATFKLVSDVFAHNGRGGTSVGAVSISTRSSSENELEFCTFYANEAMEGVGAAVECSAGTTARYNIMSANGGPMTPTEVHGNCTYEYTISSPGTPIPGATNHQADPMFVNPAAADLSDRDFHVLPDSAAVVCADPMVTFTDDTKYDIEDKPRTKPATLGAYQVPGSGTVQGHGP